jgi:hypothetical protein
MTAGDRFRHSGPESRYGSEQVQDEHWRSNLLATYKDEVIIVTDGEKNTIRRCKTDDDLEEQLIILLTQKHSKYIYGSQMGATMVQAEV